MKLSIYLFCAAMGLGGCAAITGPSGSSDVAAIRAWARQQGGVLIDQRLNRAQSIGASLTVKLPCPVRYHILNHSGLTAYSWPGGEVFLSAGLIDAASDDEVAAAIAHELGHLVNDARRQGAVGLRGADAPLELELHADTTGKEVLAASGRPTSALITLLQKVSAANASTACRHDIAARIQRLQDIPAH